MGQINNIYAVLVSYNFDEAIKKNINQIQKQAKLIWIDNTETMDLRTEVEDILNEFPSVQYYKNIKNLGLPASYNYALNIAKKNKAKYFITFDQDTYIPDNTIDNLIALMNKYNLDSIGPNYCEKKSNNSIIEFPPFLISSCNITKIDVFNEIEYDESFFIDNVDVDFCMNLTKHNYKFAIANQVKIKHEIGNRYNGKFGIKFQAHSPKRYYYIFRNYYYLKKKYDNSYINKLRLRLIFELILVVLLFKKMDRNLTLGYIKQGILEGEKI